MVPPGPNEVKRRIFVWLLPFAALVSFGLGIQGWLSGRVVSWAAIAGIATGVALAGFAFAFQRFPARISLIERLLVGFASVVMAVVLLIGAISHDDPTATFELIRQGVWLPIIYGVAFLALPRRWGAIASWSLWLVLAFASSSHLLEPAGHTPAEIGTIVEILISNAVVIIVLMGVAWVIRVGERRAATLEFAANTDRLTGLANRRQGERRLEDEAERAMRYKRPLSVVLFDLDLFKTVNDTFGHDVGDTVLQQVPVALAGWRQESDVLARWGGEEFLVVAPEMDLDRALQMAERFRSKIEEHDFDVGWQMTASFGVAQLSGGETAADMVRRADEAMYAAKRNGRNAVWSSSLQRDADAVVTHFASGAPTRTSDRLPPVRIPEDDVSPASDEASPDVELVRDAEPPHPLRRSTDANEPS